VLAAVHHAEVVAHRIGEPFGSLVLAVAVTVIEVALIVTLMVSGGPETASLARDTVFAAVMITTNGIVGISLLLGALRYGVTLFNAEGSGAALATVATLATLSLVLPTFTTSQPGPEFSPAQLTFAALAALALYGMFVLTQTVRHRDFFLAVTRDGVAVEGAFGSAMASIGLTIPVIALASVWLEGPLLLGLGSTQMVLLALTVVVSVLTVVPGRATRLQGGVHLVLLAAFLFLAINP
jgi:Ca2+:H+ antiporter